METTGKNRNLRGAAVLPAILSGLLLSGCIAGPTYGTGKGANEQLLEDVTGILQLGPKDEERIEYKPRPELVKPSATQTASLPAPQTSVTEQNPAWPESPEQRRKRIRDEATANRDSVGFRPSVAAPEIDREEQEAIMRNRAMGNSNVLPMGNSTAQREDFNRRLAVSQQGSPNNRRYLSEPPLEYRVPAGGAPTNDVGEDEWKKEQRLKREARTRAGKSAWTWADVLPW